jgi:chaperonin cofactor prefoldin
MKIDDLDSSSGELLTQLFQTRRMLLKSEQRIAELEETLNSVKMPRTELNGADDDAPPLRRAGEQVPERPETPE